MELKKYIHHLLTAVKLSLNSVNRHIASIRFMLRHVCNKHDYIHHLHNVRVPRTIPTVLSEEEIALLIDSKRMVINIRQGKGKKDRQAILSELALRCLRTYWRLFRMRSAVKSDYLFIPTKSPMEGTYDQAMSHTAVTYVIAKAQQASGIKKKSHHTSSAILLPSISLNAV